MSCFPSYHQHKQGMACRQKNHHGGTKRLLNEEAFSQYEQIRNRRIKENMERMHKLGLLNVGLQLKSQTLPKKPTPFGKKTTRKGLILSQSLRRSSRLQSLTPISYKHICAYKRKHETSKDVEYGISESEIYTEEHEKLLGDSKTSWRLYVDGYGKEGLRIYDPVNGHSCHQCSVRRKTLGLRTHCGKCKLVQGQYCGDCLYMRYGENVIEANQNPNWICPVCRGICNCNRCRRAKGLMPIDHLYWKVSRLGFKSVAHYLNQTRRSGTSSEGSGAKDLVNAKKLQISEDMREDISYEQVFILMHEGSEEDQNASRCDVNQRTMPGEQEY